MAAIGIFDSGVGGFTVLRALKQAFPSESFVYLGDTARLPYGSKSPSTIRRYLAQNIAFLKRFPIKALIVACNSASSVVESHEWEGIPLYEVIEPGAAEAVREGRRIAVLGTRATIASGAYLRAIHRLKPETPCIQQACPLLVPLVEEGWERDDLARLAIERYLEAPLKWGADTLILGCTHYPVLRGLFASVAGPGVTMIDSAEVLARQLARDLASGRVPPQPGGAGSISVWTTDPGSHFREIAERILGNGAVDDWQLADLA